MILNLNPDQIKQLERTGKITVFRMLGKQPERGMEQVGKPPFCDKRIPGIWFADQDYYTFIAYRYPVGSMVDVKETWAWTPDGFPEVKREWNGKPYNDYELRDGGIIFKTRVAPNWRSPVTMPKEAVRYHVEVVSCEVKRVGEINPPEMMKIMGLQGLFILDEHNKDITVKTFINHFNSLHAKPVRWKDGWVCYPYDMSNKTITNLLIDCCPKKRYVCRYPGLWKYKGKLLTIFPDPYGELVEMRKR